MITLVSSRFAGLPIPKSIAKCPICDAPLANEDVYEWESNTGEITESGFSVECTMQPDIDGGEWPDWHAEHWSHPYIDWVPIEPVIHEWLCCNYRVAMESTG